MKDGFLNVVIVLAFLGFIIGSIGMMEFIINSKIEVGLFLQNKQTEMKIKQIESDLNYLEKRIDNL